MAYRRMRMAKSKDNFDIKAELNKAVGTLTDAAQKKLKAKVNPDSKINPTDPALLPYTAEVKNAVQVAQGTKEETSPVSIFGYYNFKNSNGTTTDIPYLYIFIAIAVIGGIIYYKYK